MKEEALKLADGFRDRVAWSHTDAVHWCISASVMIRRLVEELDKKGEPVAWIYKRNDGIKFLNWKTWKDCQTCNGEFIPLYTTPQTKPLSDEEIDIIKYAVGSAICSLESEINEQEKTFKGYEHCSNLSGLREELNDCLKAKDILERHGIK